MPLTCIVVGCGSRADRDKLSFFAVPTATKFAHATHLNELSAQRRLKWITAIKRDDLTDSILKYEKVCSKHFISGKPADLQDVNHPDWVPNQNMGHTVGHILKRKSDLDRMSRAKQRRECHKLEITPIIEEETLEEEVESGTATQTDLTSDDLMKQAEKFLFIEKKMNELQRKFNKTLLTYETLESDNQKCHYLTGLDFPILKLVFGQIEKSIPVNPVSALEPFQQLLLTLMKLRLDFPFKYLGYKFGISQTTCATYFNAIIHIMYIRFKSWIIWPRRHMINHNIPSCFKEVFHEKTTVIIDCFEVFIQKPSSYLTQQQSWSNYKHHNTIKFLIGITPQGTISYISNAWGGRTSDKQIVESSDFLSYIKPHDIVLADRGFLIKDCLTILQAKLVIPAFTKGKKQLIPLEIEDTRKIAHVRIHVERIIGAIKSKFSILKGTIPISMLTHTSDDVNILDKIVIVCCALINMCSPIVPL